MKLSEALQELSNFFRTKEAQDLLNIIDGEQGNIYKSVKILYYACILLICFGVSLSLCSVSFLFRVLTCIFLFAFIILTSAYMTDEETIKQYGEYGKELLKNMISYIFPFLQTNTTDTIDIAKIKESKIFPVFFAYFNDDTITGEYENAKIKIAESTLSYFFTGTSKKMNLKNIDPKAFTVPVILFTLGLFVFPNLRFIFPDLIYGTGIQPKLPMILILLNWTILVVYLIIQKFKGVIVDIEFNKNFSGHTIIVPKNIMPHSLGKEYKKVLLEDVNFMKEYNVYSTSQIDARYILTTAFIKRFHDIKLSFNVKSLKCSFKHNKMLIAIATKKDLFSIFDYSFSTHKPKPAKTNCQRAFNEVYSLLAIIQVLKLNKKIGL